MIYKTTEKHRQRSREWAASHPEQVKANRKRRYAKNRESAIEYNTQYYNEHKEKVQAYKAQYYLEHREQERTRAAAWVDKHPDLAKAYQDRYQIEHRDERLAKAAKRYAEHPEEVKERVRQWQKAHPEMVRANVKRRKALKRNAIISDLTAAQWQECVAEFNYCCAYCLTPLDIVTQDHMTPLVRDGAHTLNNVIPACRSCNGKKGTKTLLDIVGREGFI